MDQDRFETEVVALASQGVKLTVANVAARARLSPRKAEAMLDAMVRESRLDSDVDEEAAVVVYRVRGLDEHAMLTGKLALLEREVTEGARRAARSIVVDEASLHAHGALDVPGSKNPILAAILGLVLGPLGLIYAAPWIVVVVASLGYFALTLVARLPLIGILLTPLIALLHIGFAIACALYAARYNRSGGRAHLALGEGSRRR